VELGSSGSSRRESCLIWRPTDSPETTRQSPVGPSFRRRLRAGVTQLAEGAFVRRYYLQESHQWVRRKVKIDGTTIFHRQCRTCRRDFVMSAGKGYWVAVHVGLLGFDLLDEETNHRWVSEECPGRQIPEEINDSRTRANEQKAPEAGPNLQPRAS